MLYCILNASSSPALTHALVSSVDFLLILDACCDTPLVPLQRSKPLQPASESGPTDPGNGSDGKLAEGEVYSVIERQVRRIQALEQQLRDREEATEQKLQRRLSRMGGPWCHCTSILYVPFAL